MATASNWIKAVLAADAADDPFSSLENRLFDLCKYLLGFYVLFILAVALILESSGLENDFSTYFRVIGFASTNPTGYTAAFFAFLMARPSVRQFGVALGLSVVLELTYYQFALSGDFSIRNIVTYFGSGLGPAGFLVLCWMLVSRKSGWGRKRAGLYVLATLGLLFYPLAAGKGIGLLTKLSPKVLDANAYIVEGCLGFYPAQEVATFLTRHGVFFTICMFVYSRLTVFLFWGIYMSLRHEKICGCNIFLAFLYAGMISLPIFVFLPLVGIDLYAGMPPWPHGELPAVKSMAPVLAPGNFPRTCLPSLHTTWVCIPLFALRRLGKGVFCFNLAIAFLTIMGALSMIVGHYSLDIFVGVPFSWLVVALATTVDDEKKNTRNSGIVACAVWVLLSVLALRYFPVAMAEHGYITWLWFCSGPALAFWCDWRLHKD